MAGEVARRNLYDAAIMGEVDRFNELRVADPFLLVEASFSCSRNILHVATMHGREDIVKEVMRTNPELARDLDSEKSSPLHMAAARGHVGIVARLLTTARETCWWRDCHGTNPVHIAAINGHADILRVLIDVDPLPAMERVRRGQNVLHLCLKHGRIEAFRYLVEKLNDLVYVEDDDGETILHSAIRLKKVDFVEYLVENHRTYELPKNSKGKTVHQIAREGTRDAAIDRILSSRISYLSKASYWGKMNDVTMVVVVLIATMAFQASVSPPGGVWQEDHDDGHKAGEAVMASSRPNIFKHFQGANKTAFFSSIVTIVLLTTGMPATNIFFMMIAMWAMWVSLASISICYMSSMIAITTHTEEITITHVISNIVWLSIAVYALFSVSILVTISSRIRVYRMSRRCRQLRAVGVGNGVGLQSWFRSFCKFVIEFYAFCFQD